MDRVALLTSYLEETPDDPFLHFALAQEYANQQKTEEAIKKYEYLLREHPDYVGTYYHAGQAYEQLDNAERAMEIYNLGINVALRLQDKHSASELEGVKMLLEEKL
ncbi:MAG: tetratricopeptide repeat protein [Saprospiraceae bacterium]|nr:tetratricopeptide repeat protein [Saprospiraceae bacterium]